MVSKTIYSIYPSNGHAFVDLQDSSDRLHGERFNIESVLSKWKSRDYKFFSPDKKLLPAPTATILIGGALAIKEDFKEKLFPQSSKKLEFLPIKVEKENWLIVNCLEATSKYNRDASVVYRGQDEKIFMVMHLVLDSAEELQSQIFVIDDSNRATIYALQSFVDRFRESNLQGLTFKEVGTFMEIRPQ